MTPEQFAKMYAEAEQEVDEVLTHLIATGQLRTTYDPHHRDLIVFHRNNTADPHDIRKN